MIKSPQVEDAYRLKRAIEMHRAGTLKAAIERYQTTEKWCRCMDFAVRVRVGVCEMCKHQHGLKVYGIKVKVQ